MNATNAISQTDAFRALHVTSSPLVLYNVWDAGSARVVAQAGAAAIATGSWSVAAAQGYDDGETLPLDWLLSIVGQIVRAVELPVTVDFESGYAHEAEAVSNNVSRLLPLGVAGINFEDQVIGGDGLYPVDEQVNRIAAIRAAANAQDVALFINARTDLFLKSSPEHHSYHLDEALVRSAAYAEAGADGFFVPALTDPELIARACENSPLPVNTMMMSGALPIAEQARLGVARISHGPGPYNDAMRDLAARADAIYAR